MRLRELAGLGIYSLILSVMAVGNGIAIRFICWLADIFPDVTILKWALIMIIYHTVRGTSDVLTSMRERIYADFSTKP